MEGYVATRLGMEGKPRGKRRCGTANVLESAELALVVELIVQCSLDAGVHDGSLVQCGEELQLMLELPR